MAFVGAEKFSEFYITLHYSAQSSASGGFSERQGTTKVVHTCIRLSELRDVPEYELSGTSRSLYRGVRTRG